MWQEVVGSGQFAVEWFDNRLNEARNEVDILMSQFRLSEALKTIYSLIWDDFCSWFLEWIKPEFGKPIDNYIYEKAIHFFEELLQLLHPFMPFITEEIYHLLKDRNDDLVVKQFSKAKETNKELILVGNKLKELITGIRDAKNKHQIKPKELITLFIETEDESTFQPIKNILENR